MSIVTTTVADATTPLKLNLVKVKEKFEAESELHLQHNFSDNELVLSSSPTSLNVFHSTDLLQYIVNVGKVTNIISHQNPSPAVNNEICAMIQDTISHDSISRMQLILSQIDQLKFEEKLLLYLKLPASLINPNVISDPLKQPLNPLGNRYEIHQTIMWIKTHLEEDPEVSLPKQDVYDEYNIFCSKNNMKPLSTADFGKVMKQVYPRVRPRRLGTRGNSRYCYAGMRKKLVLKPPTLPSTYDEDLGEDGEHNTKEDMLGAASILIREWAETYFNVKFPTLCTLGKYLVDNLFVDNQSLAAICIMSSSENFQSSTRNTAVSGPSGEPVIYLNKAKMVSITEKAMGQISMIDNPAKFVIQLIYTTMGFERLSSCCVKNIKGCKNYHKIPGDMLNVMSVIFSQFLQDHDYPNKYRFIEMEKINKYLNSAIIYARKKVNAMQVQLPSSSSAEN